MGLRAKSKTACEIARIDPLRLNEAIHAGFYPCAPETRPGSSRVYDVDQIVALRIYGVLLGLSLSAERAGYIACEAYGLYNGREDYTMLVYSNMRNGAWHMLAFSADSMSKDLPRLAMLFDIQDLRKEVIAHLEFERENQIVGED
jgi:hypothetical protein